MLDQLCAASSREPADWLVDRELAAAVLAFVDNENLSRAGVALAVNDLARERGPEVYAELIFQLVRISLDGSEAEAHWHAVLEHREALSDRVGDAVDLRVGLLSYFLDVRPHLQRPAVVEMDWVQRTVASVYVDELTDLPNFRAFHAALAREMARSESDTTPLSLVMIDVDDFKSLNDEYGHQAGNTVLAMLGRVLRDTLRREDFSARYGGEEFVVLLPATSKTDANELAERLRTAISTTSITLGSGCKLSITASLGVATCPGDADDATLLLERADQALYDAKHSGKNTVCYYGQSSRSFGRRSARWIGRLACPGTGSLPVTTEVIGEGGMFIRCPRPVEVESLVELRITPPPMEPLRLAARVVRVDPAERDGFGVALRFVEQGTSDRARLRNWIREQRDGD